MERKLEMCQIKRDDKKLPQNDELLHFLESDGLYIDNSFLAKNSDINVQKLEERLLNNNQKQYFKANGEIKLDIDLLANERTRPADLAFETSDAFQTVENNAIVTDRMNSFKKRYFRIDVIVGRLVLKKYDYLLTAEHQKMLDLKHICKLYDRRVALALIPFYQYRLEYLANEISDKKNSGGVNINQEVAYL